MENNTLGNTLQPKEKKQKYNKAVNDSTLTSKHISIWVLAGMGIFIDGFDLFIIGIAMPLLLIQYPILKSNPTLVGFLSAAAPIGAIFGASILGRLTDVKGRKFVLMLNLFFFVTFSILGACSWNIWALFIFRFFIGVGIGGEYPVSSSYISETIPKKYRKKILIGNFLFQSLGAVFAALFGLLILFFFPYPNMWRIMLLATSIMAIILFFFRLRLPESPKWLAQHGHRKKAGKQLSKIVGKKVKVSKVKDKHGEFKDIFKPQYIKLTILSCVPWFLMDIAMYGIGLFTPIIMATLFVSSSNHMDYIHHDMASIRNSLVTDVFLVVGILLALVLITRIGIIRMQIMGFIGMGVGMMVIVLTVTFMKLGAPGYLPLVFGGFIVFYLFVNLGPNPMTYLLPARIYPQHLRATGHGFASAMAKVGAAVGILFLPIFNQWIGLSNTLLIMAVLSFIGAIITLIFSLQIIKDKKNRKNYKRLVEDLEELVHHKI